MNCWMGGWMDGWVDGWMSGWVGERERTYRGRHQENVLEVEEEHLVRGARVVGEDEGQGGAPGQEGKGVEGDEGRFGGHDRAQEEQDGTDVAGLQKVGGVGGDLLHVQLQGHLWMWMVWVGWVVGCKGVVWPKRGQGRMPYLEHKRQEQKVTPDHLRLGGSVRNAPCAHLRRHAPPSHDEERSKEQDADERLDGMLERAREPPTRVLITLWGAAVERQRGVQGLEQVRKELHERETVRHDGPAGCVCGRGPRGLSPRA